MRSWEKRGQASILEGITIKINLKAAQENFREVSKRKPTLSKRSQPSFRISFTVCAKFHYKHMLYKWMTELHKNHCELIKNRPMKLFFQLNLYSGLRPGHPGIKGRRKSFTSCAKEPGVEPVAAAGGKCCGIGHNASFPQSKNRGYSRNRYVPFLSVSWRCVETEWCLYTTCHSTTLSPQEPLKQFQGDRWFSLEEVQASQYRLSTLGHKTRV